MELRDEIEFILGLKMTPSQRLCLMALLIAEDNDLTTNELNHITNCLKTFNDYMDIFDESIKLGLVTVEPKKGSSGYMRQHFCINRKTLTELIESKD